MRSHGWSGNAPASDEDAVSRILDVVDRITDSGSVLRIAAVARTLGVTRQTVYRYFSGTEVLLLAAADRSAEELLTRIANAVAGIADPAVALVLATAVCIEAFEADARLRRLFGTPAVDGRGDVAPAAARRFGRAMPRRLDVDWAAHGYREADLDGLGDFCLRMLHSFALDRALDGTHDPTGTRSPDELRRFLARWMGPAIVYPRLAQSLKDVASAALEQRGRRRRAAS